MSCCSLTFPSGRAVCIWLGQLSGFFVREEIKKKNYITFYCQYLSTVNLTLWLSCALLRPWNYSYVNSANPDGLDTVALPVSDLPEYRYLVEVLIGEYTGCIFQEEVLRHLLFGREPHAIAKLRISVVWGCHWKFFVYCVTQYMNIPQTKRLHHVLKWLLSRGYKRWKTLKPSGQNVIAVAYKRFFMSGSNYTFCILLQQAITHLQHIVCF